MCQVFTQGKSYHSSVFMQQYFKMSCDLWECSNMCVSVQDEWYGAGCANGQANSVMNVQSFVLKAKR